MPYGTIKVDNITFDNGGTDKLITVSGLFFSTSGALTVTGTISGGNVTAPTATFTTLTGTTTAGTTATFTSGSFTSLTGVTTTGTTAIFTSGSFTSLTGVTTTVTSGVFGLGSAAAPSIAFSGDTNNGIYSPGADQVAISTSGVGRLFVDASGNIKVSTGEIFQTSATSYIRLDGGTGSGTGANLIVFGESNGSAPGRISLSAVGTGAIIASAGGSERLRITSAGLVGLGTSSPGSRLSVEAVSSDTTPLLTSLGSANGSEGAIFLRGGSTAGFYYDFKRNGTTGSLEIQGNQAGFNNICLAPTSGAVGIGTASPGYPLDIQSTSATLRIKNTTAPATGGTSSLLFEGINNFSGTSQSYINSIQAGNSGATQLTFGTSTSTDATATERMRITSAGLVGLGTSSPSDKLHVIGGGIFSTATTAANLLQVRNSDFTSFGYFGVEGPTGGVTVGGSLANATLISSGATGTPLQFGTAGTIKATLDSSGRLGIGTTGPSQLLHVAGNTRIGANDASSALLQVGAGATGSRFAVVDLVGDTTYTDYGLRIIRGNTGANTASQITHRGTGSFTLQAVEGAPITFETSSLERARIDSSGRLLVGTSTDGGADGLTIYPAGSGAGSAAIGVWNKTNTGLEAAAQFRVSATTIGSISYNNTLVAYNTTSDYRLKENVIPVPDGIARCKQLKPSRFNFKVNPDHTVDGFIAHEAQAVVPECVTGTKDEVDADGNPVYQGIDQSKLVPLLTAALQEAIAKIEALETRLSALEGK